MKSIKFSDAIVSWEVGLAIVFFGLIFLLIGTTQSKKEFDIDNLPFVKPTTKIVLGGFCLLFGLIQLMPVIFNLS